MSGMSLAAKVRRAPGRVATGAYILHSGLTKWSGGEQQAVGIHGTAANAFAFLKPIPPRRFLKLLSIAEIGVGAALLAPMVPAALAGAALTAFSGGLVTMYLRTPAMRKPNSIWPSPGGMAVSKDVWMLGIGAGLLADAAFGDDAD
jgi:uncharacterized membrane protein YphA (DoxX/SURF4 family)